MEVSPGGLQRKFSSFDNFTTEFCPSSMLYEIHQVWIPPSWSKDKMSFSFHYYIVCTALENCLRYNIEMNQYLHTVPAAWLLCVHIQLFPERLSYNRGQCQKLLWVMVVFTVAWVNLKVFQRGGRKQHKHVLSPSLLLNHHIIPIIPIDIVA